MNEEFVQVMNKLAGCQDDVFSFLSLADSYSLQGEWQFLHFEPNQVIVHEGHLLNHLFVLLSGEVLVLKSDAELKFIVSTPELKELVSAHGNILRQFDAQHILVGESGLWEGVKTSATIVAKGVVRALRLRQKAASLLREQIQRRSKQCFRFFEARFPQLIEKKSYISTTNTLKNFNEEVLARKSVVLREGEVSKKVCFLAEGSVLILRRVGGRPIKVSSLAPGSVIGLDISPNPKKSEFSFKAETDIRCYCIALANIRILPAEWVRRLKEQQERERLLHSSRQLFFSKSLSAFSRLSSEQSPELPDQEEQRWRERGRVQRQQHFQNLMNIFDSVKDIHKNRVKSLSDIRLKSHFQKLKRRRSLMALARTPPPPAPPLKKVRVRRARKFMKVVKVLQSS